MDKEEKKVPDGNDNLSDNKVDVEIEPDVKSNIVKIQICSCALIFNCFDKKNID